MSATDVAWAAVSWPDPVWQRLAGCVGANPETFYPDDKLPVADREALADQVAAQHCRFCPVVASCGAFADENESLGVWGGQYRYKRRLKYTAVELPSMRTAGAA